MPYNSIGDLPDTVQNVLPKHAQEIYMSSYNNAHKEYYLKKKQTRSRRRFGVYMP